MATEFTKTIGADDSKTEVSGVTVPFVKTSDLEVYVGKGKIEEIEVTNAGAGYTNITFTGSAGTDNTTNSVPLVFSGGGGSAPTVRATVTSNQIDSKFWTDANGTEFTGSGGSDYTTAPNISISGLSGGTGGQLTAKIYTKKTSVTDYSISGTSGNATITFTSALSNGDKVLVKRVTKVNTAANTFAAGAAITATDLNKSFDQIRHRVEELPEVTSTAVTNGDKDDITVSGNNWTIKDNAVDTGKILNDAVTADKLKDHASTDSERAVTRNHIRNDAIDGTKIADDSINSEHIAAGSIDAEHYAPGSVDYTALGGEAVHMNKIYPQSINEAKIWGANNPTDGYVLTSNLTAASSDPSNVADLIWTDPSDKAAGSVLETFTAPCAGKSITVQSGTYTPTNVTAVQEFGDNDWDTLNGSEIAYKPPLASAKMVIYKFKYHAKYVDANPWAIWHTRFIFDGSEVTGARQSYSWNNNAEAMVTFEFPILITGSSDSQDATTGQIKAGTWTSNKTMKIEVKRYGASHYPKLHQTYYYNNQATVSYIVKPIISITAIA